MKFRSILITGTDTGIGKTTVSCVLAAGMRAAGHRVGVFKPAETGCPRVDGEPVPQDALQLRFFSECRLPLTDLCVYALRDPLAPLMAARREGVEISLDAIVERHTRIAGAHDITLVEGAGGLLVPVADGHNFVEIARRLDATLLVVVGNRLGAINHALLTLDRARAAGLPVLGYVINAISDSEDLASATNLELLRELAGPPLAVVPFLAPLESTEARRRELAAVFASTFCDAPLLRPVGMDAAAAGIG